MKRAASRRAVAWRAGGRIAAAVLLLCGRPAAGLAAQDPPLNAAALFLVFPVGARAAGMGQAAVALEGRGEAAFWNPAGLGGLATNEVGLHTAKLVAGRTSTVTAYFRKQGIGVLGGAAYLVDYGDSPVTDSVGNVIGQTTSRDFEFLASFASELSEGLLFGVSYKLVEFRVGCSGNCSDVTVGGGSTHAVDVGGQLALGATRSLRVGAALRNVGFRLQVLNRDQADPLPARLAVGAVYRLLLPPLRGAAAGERLDLLVAADVDSPWGRAGASEMRVGLDVGYGDVVRVRGGYAFVQDGLSGPSVGLGLSTEAIGVDLARTFLSGSDLVTDNPTFFSFRVTF
jgi:hypothetical protein